MKLMRISVLRIHFRPKRFTTFVLMLVIWAGLASAAFAGISYDVRNREYLLGRAQTIAAALPASEISNLQANKDDLTSLSYNNIKDRLQQIRANNHDMGHIYLLSRQGNAVVTYVDSETLGSEDYVAPGSYFGASTDRVASAFNYSDGFLEGPRQARENIWLSAYAPVIDPKTNAIVAVVAVDTNAFLYYAQVLLYSLVPLLLAAIPFVGLMRDIKLQSKEHEILQLKNQFVSIASHELRSPLAGMLWAIQSLTKNSDKRFSKSEAALLEDMYRSTEASLTTVNEILDLSIFERGQAHKLQHELIDMSKVTRQVIATLKLGAQEKLIHVTMTGDWPEHIYTKGDVGALKRALMNTISNAIKYSPEKSIIEMAYRAGEHEHIISVKDHGIGIPVEEQEKVLEGYYRATNASSVQAHGTGLGLWLSKKIAEEHGGRLWLNSHLNQGTTIFIALPIADGPDAKQSDQ